MANSLLQFVSAFLGLGGTEVTVADQSLSSGSLVAVYQVNTALNTTAAIYDFGVNLFTKGVFKIRVKTVGALATANAQISLAVSQTTTFATKQIVATINAVSAAATVAAPSTQSYVGYFDNDPTTFRYARWENAGVVLGATPCTFDAEILALP